MALSGVRISCDMLARNKLLARLARSGLGLRVGERGVRPFELSGSRADSLFPARRSAHEARR